MAKAPKQAGMITFSVAFPLGRVTVRVGEGGRVEEIGFGPGGRAPRSHGSHPLARALREYLAGRSPEFSPPIGGLSRHSPFDRAVWNAARRVPPGRTRTYGQIAADIGRPGSARAVGGALGRNPVPLAVPCHRIVAAGGSLGGFGPGLELKRWLLGLEKGAASRKPP